MSHNQAAEAQIIKDINNYDPQRDDGAKLSAEILQAQQEAGAYWQKMAQNINAKADLTKLGLKPGDELLGVKESGLLIREKATGKLVSLDPVRLTPQQASDASAASCIYGNKREFNLYPDGRLEYTVKKNPQGATGNDREFYSNIARDALKAQTGKDASETDVYNFIGQMKRVNPNVNFDRIYPGDVLRIPMHAQAGDLGVIRPSVAGLDKQKPPTAFEGLSANKDGQTDASIKNAKTTETVGVNGTTIKKTEGQLDDGFMTFGRTGVVRTDTTDRDGNLVERKLEYDGGKDIDIKGADGQKVKIANVRNIDLKWDYIEGMYKGTLRTGNGTFHEFTVDRQGKVANAKSHARLVTEWT